LSWRFVFVVTSLCVVPMISIWCLIGWEIISSTAMIGFWRVNPAWKNRYFSSRYWLTMNVSRQRLNVFNARLLMDSHGSTEHFSLNTIFEIHVLA
jgi:hypothetical protein